LAGIVKEIVSSIQGFLLTLLNLIQLVYFLGDFLYRKVRHREIRRGFPEHIHRTGRQSRVFSKFSVK